MSLPILKNKLIKEINLIPDEKLSELYNFVHCFRLGIERVKTNKDREDILSYCGSWKDINIDEFISDIAKRRSNAFHSRRNNQAVSH